MKRVSSKPLQFEPFEEGELLLLRGLLGAAQVDHVDHLGFGGRPLAGRGLLLLLLEPVHPQR